MRVHEWQSMNGQTVSALMERRSRICRLLLPLSLHRCRRCHCLFVPCGDDSRASDARNACEGAQGEGHGCGGGEVEQRGRAVRKAERGQHAGLDVGSNASTRIKQSLRAAQRSNFTLESKSEVDDAHHSADHLHRNCTSVHLILLSFVLLSLLLHSQVARPTAAARHRRHFL